MTLPVTRVDREYGKFVEDSSGNVAIRVTLEGISGTITINDGETFTIKDQRGFTLFEIDSEGNVKYKGTMIKI